ncbi:MAG: hypothetical protein O7G88_03550 [bacterium]|nr:hypothetical protein [bacterium]
MDNIYLAPEAELIPSPSTGEYGSPERAVVGDYHFVIGEVISEAWEKTKGAKWTMLMAFGLYLLVYLAVTFTVQFILSALGLSGIPEPDGRNAGSFMAYSFLQTTILTFATIPMMAGLFIMGLRRSMQASISASSIMRHYDKTVTLAITLTLMYVMIAIGFVLLVIPGIYLSVAYYMAIPLVVDKGFSPWQALETSRQAISKRWFSVFGLGLMVTLINMMGGFALGIGLIWTLPFTVIVFGVLYRNMFGCEAATIAD